MGQGSDTIAQRVLRAKSDRIALPARRCATLRTKRHVPRGGERQTHARRAKSTRRFPKVKAS